MTNEPKKTSAAAGSGPGGGTRIQSVARAAQILLWVANQPYGATPREIALAHGLATPTTYHLVNTLADHGFLTRDVHQRYVLGKSAAVIAQAYLRGKAVPDNLLALVRELAQQTAETVYLADWGERDIRVLASVEGTQIVRVAEVAGGPYEHGHARANGKVLLAYAWPEVRDAYLRTHPLAELTKNTITDRDKLDAELQRIRRRGYAIDQEEFAVGLCCIAAPLLQGGNVVAALGLAVPTDRFKKRREELTEILLERVRKFEFGGDRIAAS